MEKKIYKTTEAQKFFADKKKVKQNIPKNKNTTKKVSFLKKRQSEVLKTKEKAIPTTSNSKYTISPPASAIATCRRFKAHLMIVRLPGAFHSLTRRSARI